jgi:tRNA nucleotidyltransferase (CCA-adding enzyme)
MLHDSHTLLKVLETSISGGNLALLLALRHRAHEHSIPAYLVGGPVRDILIGDQIRDLDFVVEGDAPAMARQLADDLGGHALTYDRFGTATVVMNDCRVDIVTARQEVYHYPGSLPEVTPGTINDDLTRRDFSINAMALPLTPSHSGVLDPYGGLNDINQKLIRTLHTNSFVDDPTRIFRAIRYEQRLNYRVDDNTLKQLLMVTSTGSLTNISGSRLRHELERMFQEERPDLALHRANDLGILTALHHSLGNLPDVARLFISGKVAPVTYMAALTYNHSPENGELLINRLNLPRFWATVIRDTIKLRQKEIQLSTPTLAPSQLWQLIEGLSSEAIVAVSRLTNLPTVAKRLSQYLNELRIITPCLNGRDLIALGVPMGPLIGHILRQLRDARLDQRISTSQEEQIMVQEILHSQNPGPINR